MKSKVRPSVLIRYSEIQKGYILYDLDNKSFLSTNTLHFKRVEFPFDKSSLKSPICKDNLMKDHVDDNYLARGRGTTLKLLFYFLLVLDNKIHLST